MAKPKPKKATKQIKLPEIPALSWPLDQKKTLWLAAGLVTIIGIIVFWPYFSGQFLYIFEDIGSDTITVFFPNLVHLARYTQEVGFPGWSFYMGPGQAVYPQGLLNPWDWIFIPMEAKSIAVAISYVQLAKLIASGVVFSLYLKKFGFENPVILVGAILYAFGGYIVVGSSWYVHTTHIFWITVALLGFEMLLRDQRWWLFPLPFVFLLGTRGYFLIIFMAIYAAVRTFDYYQGDWKKVAKVFGRMVLCGVLALMLSAPFLGGKISKLKSSPRVTGNVSRVEKLIDKPVFASGSEKHNATAILRWFSNDVVGTGDEYKGFRNYLEGPLFYIGLISLLLFPQFFWLAEKRQKWLYGGFLFIWLWLIIFPWFRFAFYAFAGDYYKGALSLFIPFSVLLVGLMALDKISKGKEINLLILAGSLLACLTALWYPYSSVQEGIQSGIQVLVSIFLLIEGIVLAGFNFKSTRQYVLPVLISIVVLEAGIFSYISNTERLAIPTSDLNKPLRHFDETNEAVAFIKSQEKDPFYRTDKVYGSVKTGYNDASIQGFFGTKIYQSHVSKHYVTFLEEMGVIPISQEASSRWVVGVAKRNQLHPLMSIKYLLAKEGASDDVSRDIYSKIEKTGPIQIFKNNYFIPFGIPFQQYFTESEFSQMDTGQKSEAIYHGVVVPDDAQTDMKGIPRADPLQIDFNAPVADRWTSLAQSAMTMTSFDHNHIKGKINLENPSVVFFSLTYDKAWQVYVDGVRSNLMLVDFGFSGVQVGKGEHQIELKYVPPMFKIGWIIFLAGFVIFLFMAIKKIRFFPIQ